MAGGIKREQLDLQDLSKYFYRRTEAVQDNAEIKDRLDNVNDALERDAIIEVIQEFTLEDMKNLGIYELIADSFIQYIKQSTSVKPITDIIDVTESDEKRYRITPTRGYITANNRDHLVYQHPLKHNANEVTETTDKRFVKSSDIENWNGKADQEDIDKINTTILTQINLILDRLKDVEDELDLRIETETKNDILTDINKVLESIGYVSEITGNGEDHIFRIEHKMNSKYIIASVIDVNSKEIVYPNIVVNDPNIVEVVFSQGNPPTKDDHYRVIISARQELLSLYPDINNITSTICNKYTFITDGTSSEYSVIHNKGSRDIVISILDSRTNELVYPNIELTSNNKIKVIFSEPPSKNITFSVFITSMPTFVNSSEDQYLAEFSGLINNALSSICKGFNFSTISKPDDDQIVTINHNFNSEDIMALVYDRDSYEVVYPTICIKDANSVILRFKNEERHNYRLVLLSTVLIDIDVNVDIVDVDEIRLSKTALTFYGLEDTNTIIPTILPENASNKKVIWSSSNNNVATVNTGLVTPVGYGTCIITAVTESNGLQATCVVSVNPPIINVTELQLSNDSLAFRTLNMEQQLSVTVLPEDATYKDVTWSSSNEDIAIVDNTGLVTAVGEGKATIVCQSKFHTEIMKMCTVSVAVEHVAVEELTLSENEITIEGVGNTFTLSYEILPIDASDKSVFYISSDNDIVKVNNTGKITAMDTGNAIVSCIANDNNSIKKTCKVHVIAEAIHVEGVSLSKQNITLNGTGATETITANIEPDNADVMDVSWTSSDPEVATVDESGLTVEITSLKAGNTIITATTADGGFTDTCLVTVEEISEAAE